LDNLNPQTIRYDWLTAGEVSGAHVLQIRADGTRVADFEFNDRGRGPKIHEELRFEPDGTQLSLQVSGHSYMGAPAQETFREEDGRAAWESTLERGDAPAGGDGHQELSLDKITLATTVASSEDLYSPGAVTSNVWPPLPNTTVV
jgi:hypothetical protein